MVLSTNRTVVIMLGVCAQVLITAVFLWRVEPYVEGRLEDESKRSLQEANLSWARVDADGRDLQVSGIAPNGMLKDRAVGIVESVPGVRKVADDLLVASAKAPVLAPEEADRRARELLSDIEDDAPIFALDLPYELHLEVEVSVLTLSGLVPDAIAKESLLNLANREFGDGRVIDRLMVAPGAPEGYLTAGTQAISAAGQLSKGIVMVREGEVIVQGLSSDNQILTKLDNVMASLPSNYQGNVQIGDQQELESLLRLHPSLAARVGRVSDQSRDETVIETIRVPVDNPADSRTLQEASAVSPPRTIVSDESRASDSSPPDVRTRVTEVTQTIDPAMCASLLQAELSQQSIGFDTGSSDIDDQSLSLMRELVRIAKLCPQVVLEIAGHTDDLGTRENNLSLSQRRAEAVMEYLVRNGVSISRLRAVGYGEERPLVENTTADRRRINRRIEFSLVDES